MPDGAYLNHHFLVTDRKPRTRLNPLPLAHDENRSPSKWSWTGMVLHLSEQGIATVNDAFPANTGLFQSDLQPVMNSFLSRVWVARRRYVAGMQTRFLHFRLPRNRNLRWHLRQL